MNDFVGGIIHNDRVARWRTEADSSRLIASSRTSTDAGSTETRRQLFAVARRRLLIVAAAASLPLLAAFVPGAAASGPTCADVDDLQIVVHGQHVVRDYVMGQNGDLAGWPPAGTVGSAAAGNGADIPGGPGPGFHFPQSIAPGASFCLSQSQSPGFHVP